MGKWSNLTHIFQMAWNHQLDIRIYIYTLAIDTYRYYHNTYIIQVQEASILFAILSVLNPNFSVGFLCLFFFWIFLKFQNPRLPKDLVRRFFSTPKKHTDQTPNLRRYDWKPREKINHDVNVKSFRWIWESSRAQAQRRWEKTIPIRWWIMGGWWQILPPKNGERSLVFFCVYISLSQWANL